MRYYLIAGEPSGDLHGSNLIRALRDVDPQSSFRLWGGDLMRKAAGEEALLIKHYHEMAYMGFSEVLRHLGKISENIRLCKEDLIQNKPDALILIDYPGFNLKIARFAKKSGIKTFYYISPKIWAWNESRIHKIKRYIDHMLVIFPFEVSFYAKHGYRVHYVGNPLLDEVEKQQEILQGREKWLQQNHLEDKPIIALLAGSRKQEVQSILKEMVRVTSRFPGFQFVIAGTRWLPEAMYAPWLSPNVRIVYNQTYALLKHATAAVVTSGTATLETALWKVPQVVVYKTGALTYRLSRWVVHIPFISLVNIIMEKEVVREIIQEDMPEQISRELEKILSNEAYRYEMLASYEALQQKLGESGASRRAAESVFKALQAS